MTGLTETVLTLLTTHREPLKALLLERESQDTKPYIDEQSNMGQGCKGCLVVPMDSAPRYKHWQPGFSCLPVESDDWLKVSKSLTEAEKLKWKPLKLTAIQKEVGATEELTKRYWPHA